MLFLENSQRKDTAVTIEDLGRLVSGSVIENQDLVVTAEFTHHPADLPKKNPDGSLFIVRRNADVDQWSTNRYPGGTGDLTSRPSKDSDSEWGGPRLPAAMLPEVLARRFADAGLEYGDVLLGQVTDRIRTTGTLLDSNALDDDPVPEG